MKVNLWACVSHIHHQYQFGTVQSHEGSWNPPQWPKGEGKVNLQPIVGPNEDKKTHPLTPNVQFRVANQLEKHIFGQSVEV